MTQFQALKLALLLWLALMISVVIPSARALDIGVQALDASISMSHDCSRKCESEFCSVPPFLRYGKYCGLLYSGCPGESPCDGLDACCMKHDACVVAKNNDYLSHECSQSFLMCIENFKRAKSAPFEGSKCQIHEVVDVITFVMEAALIAGRTFHNP